MVEVMGVLVGVVDGGALAEKWSKNQRSRVEKHAAVGAGAGRLIMGERLSETLRALLTEIK